MDRSIIYFDNAATSFPKPEVVYQMADRHFRSLTSPGRGAHSLAMKSGRAVYESRESIASFLGVRNSERLLFTPGCTYSMNMVLKGFLVDRLKTLPSERHVVLLSSLEHNAVMRPLEQLKHVFDFRCEMLPYQPGRFCHPDDVREYVQRLNPALLILTEGSNVTGEVADTKAIANICRDHGVPLLVDAAQTAGRFEHCLSHDGISFWCASAHKGLMSGPGLGLLYVNPEFDLEPLIAGGTGSASEQFELPSVYPDHLESGTSPAFLIATLATAIEWLRETTVESVRAHEAALAERFLRWCCKKERLQTFAPHQTALDQTILQQTGLPIVSFRIAGITSDVVADFLDRTSAIAVRPGLHCAAQAHRTLKTTDTGLVRVSFGYFNSAREVDLCCHKLEELLDSGS